MATVTVPQPVPFRKPTETIPQTKLEAILALKRSIRDLESELESAETEVKASLQAGAIPEEGLFRAFLKVSERRSVPWKQVVERELGKAYAKRVLTATKPDRFTHLVVSA